MFSPTSLSVDLQTRVVRLHHMHAGHTGWVKSKLMIFSEYVNKTEKIGGM